ncbi:MAG: DUF1343 domain-containing protein [Tannerella sp.]|jgi:uncharacterized protein YbbC (DUF1343 family)|nr:DUF1343 domain-containing protein [Tannerella sp.]
MIRYFNNPVWEESTGNKVGIVCNQTAWHPQTGEYLFETFYRLGILKRVFMPEHGLFGELQDQVKLDDSSAYDRLGFEGCEFVSLYGSDEASLSANDAKLNDLDALIVDLQDVGVRYYTYLSTLRNIFMRLKNSASMLPVWVIDRENPAGKHVEGTPLKAEYSSFIGISGLPHRYGLSFGEVAAYLYTELQADFPLNIVSKRTVGGIEPWAIPPSPNIPGLFTADFYSGQCLWEGTNVSEGRGTTRPFEVFGAPWMESVADYNRKHNFNGWNDPAHPLYDPGALLRWHRFIPTFHKYKDQVCFGFQLLRQPANNYHALLHALKIIRFIAENCSDFAFRPGKYEAGNDRTAIELLVGDNVLLNYLYGKETLADIRNYLSEEEYRWKSLIQTSLLSKRY